MEYDIRYPDLSQQEREVTVKREEIVYSFGLRVDYRFHHMSPTGISSREEKRRRSLANDLCDLAAAVYVADRVFKRVDSHKGNRHIRINVPVSCPDRFDCPESKQMLQRILRWYSPLDEFEIEFRPREGARAADQQGVLFSANRGSYDAGARKIVTLWSGGLDSLVGLLAQINNVDSSHFHLVGGGSNKEVFGVQSKLFREVTGMGIFDSSTADISKVSIDYYRVKDLPGQRNPVPRTRGFVFLLSGLAKLVVEGSRELQVYENGVGAINLPFSGGLSGVHHSRAVHPRTLMLVEQYAELICGRAVSIVNPFLFYTKSAMCRVLNSLTSLDMVFKTSITCDSKPRLKGEEKVRHCGTCSSCILRKAALMNSLGRDWTKYKDPSGVTGPLDRSVSVDYCGMKEQVGEIERQLKSAQPWKSFRNSYPDITEVITPLVRKLGITESSVKTKIIGLYRNYVDEWKSLNHVYKGLTHA